MMVRGTRMRRLLLRPSCLGRLVFQSDFRLSSSRPLRLFANVSIRSCWRWFANYSLTMMSYLPRRLPTSVLVYSLAPSVYLWEEQGIKDREFDSTVKEFWKMSRDNPVKKNSNCQVNDARNGEPDNEEDDWEAIIVKKHFQVYRRLIKGNKIYLYQYKIYGTFTDIPAKAFFLVQLDTEFRKTWDKLVVKLDVVDDDREASAERDTSSSRDVDYESRLSRVSSSSVGAKTISNFDTGNQVIHWVMHYPYPMYSREYCYVRRAKVDRDNNLMILVSRSTDHANCDCNADKDNRRPSSKASKFVRVTSYDSRMVIRPHSSFDEDGFDYLLTYFDDPQSNFPSAAYKWMAYSGVPDFVNKLYDAAVKLNRESIDKKKAREEEMMRQEEELKRQEQLRRQEEEELRRRRRGQYYSPGRYEYQDPFKQFQDKWKERIRSGLERHHNHPHHEATEWGSFDKYTAPFVMPFIGMSLRYRISQDYGCQETGNGNHINHSSQSETSTKSSQKEDEIIDTSNKNQHASQLGSSKPQSSSPVHVTSHSSSTISSSLTSSQASPQRSTKTTLLSYFYLN